MFVIWVISRVDDVTFPGYVCKCHSTLILRNIPAGYCSFHNNEYEIFPIDCDFTCPQKKSYIGNKYVSSFSTQFHQFYLAAISFEALQNSQRPDYEFIWGVQNSRLGWITKSLFFIFYLLQEKFLSYGKRAFLYFPRIWKETFYRAHKYKG